MAGFVASSTCAYSLYDIAWAASISPLSRACMSNCCWTSVTSDGAIPALVMPGEQLELVAEAPVADLLAAQVGGRGDALVRERHLVGARPLEDLRDVGDARALLARGERLGHPGDRVVGLALREHRLRDDVDAALEDLHVEPALLVEALVDGGEVAGELALGHPLQLQLDGRQAPPAAELGAAPPPDGACGVVEQAVRPRASTAAAAARPARIRRYHRFSSGSWSGSG